MKQKKTILCVDNNSDNCELMKFFFADAGYNVLTCSTPDDCLNYILTGDISAVILDYRLADIEGSEVCREIRKHNSKLPIVFFTGDALEDSRQKGINAGANAYLLKPNDLGNIVPTVTHFVEAN